MVPGSNRTRWKNEPDDKYTGCGVAAYIQQELELIKRIGQSTSTRKVLESYFSLCDTFFEVTKRVKGIKQAILKNKEIVVNTIENLKEFVPVEKAIKVFNLSRATYQNYKTIVLNKCDSSFFLWCVKKYPHQLLKKEILQIKKYMEDQGYIYWSKSSVYLQAVRDNAVSFCLTTWYKYCKLLGYTKNRHLRPKKTYTSLESHRPNQLWCADVTIFKTADGIKHYLHFLMDHYSKKILGCRVETSSNGLAIRHLIKEAFIKYKPDKQLLFLTDGGSENCNQTVGDCLKKASVKHLIAQKDIQCSNSAIEAFNKVIKHQFLLPKNLSNRKQLIKALEQDIYTYNFIRPQLSLAGNTPDESHSGMPHDFKRLATHFQAQKAARAAQNRQNNCKICLKIT